MAAEAIRVSKACGEKRLYGPKAQAILCIFSKLGRNKQPINPSPQIRGHNSRRTGSPIDGLRFNDRLKILIPARKQFLIFQFLKVFSRGKQFRCRDCPVFPNSR